MDEQDWPNLVTIVVIVFSLLLCMFELFHNEKLRNKEKPKPSQ